MYNYQNYADKRFNSNKVKRYQKDGVLFFFMFCYTTRLYNLSPNNT